MSPERWLKLDKDPRAVLARYDLLDGWHWCAEWDCLLVGPGMSEILLCKCDLGRDDVFSIAIRRAREVTRIIHKLEGSRK